MIAFNASRNLKVSEEITTKVNFFNFPAYMRYVQILWR
jgi:hypothetical protein